MLQKLAIGLAANRILFGVAFLAAPAATGSGWIGRDAKRTPVKLLLRAVGARDLVLGAGALAALTAERCDPRSWMATQAVCDVADLAATFAARDSIPEAGFRAAAALAGVSAAIAIAGTVGLGDETAATVA